MDEWGVMKKLAVVIGALLGFTYAAQGQYATLIGTLQSTNGMPASNYSISFTPSQFGYVAGTGVIINTTTSCATSVDGSVVGIPNPLDAPPVTVAFTGTLTPANYFVKYAFYDASGSLTLVSPETVIQLNSTGQLIVASPTSGMPAGSVGMKVYIAASTNAETLQGSTTGSAAFIQSVPLTGGAAVPSTNTTICKQIANDAIWPSGTGYTVSLTDTSGNTLPGYPMQWQLMGPNSTINLSSGLPYYHGTVFFPTPILASPINHGLQSISGPLGLSGYNLTNVGAIGIGTTLPAWPIDVEDGGINTLDGYKVNGGAGTSGQVLCSDGNFFDLPCTVYSPSNPPPSVTYTFSPRFAVSGSNVDLASVLGAGSCTNCSATFDIYGRATAYSSGSTPSVTFTQTDVTASRSLGTTFQNTSGAPMMVQGFVITTAGGANGNVSCSNGATSGLGNTTFSQDQGATDAGGSAEFHTSVPASWFYQCNAAGSMNPTLSGGKWFETIL